MTFLKIYRTGVPIFITIGTIILPIYYIIKNPKCSFDDIFHMSTNGLILSLLWPVSVPLITTYAIFSEN